MFCKLKCFVILMKFFSTPSKWRPNFKLPWNISSMPNLRVSARVCDVKGGTWGRVDPTLEVSIPDYGSWASEFIIFSGVPNVIIVNIIYLKKRFAI